MFTWDNSYARDVPLAGLAQPMAPAPNPSLVILNAALADRLGLDSAALRSHAAAWFSGKAAPPGAQPWAMAYAGHQFGGFSPVLGDGRAHLLGEIVTPQGRFDLHLKGSGRTAFSRGGDGRAHLAPMLREYLISEAMAALGIPTSRALGVVTTGQAVLRDGFRREGAVLARLAASHIRIGTFEYFAHRGDLGSLRALMSHTLARHYPSAPPTALGLLEAVIAAQTETVARWMGVGFVHGVMNTDNMTLSGETIDYGPCAFLDSYDPEQVFSSIDAQGRYAFGNQPRILGWNIARLAEALLPFLHDDAQTAVDLANARLGQIEAQYLAAYHRVMRGKFGLAGGGEAGDEALIAAMLAALEGHDFTQSFRDLTHAAAAGDATLPPALALALGPLLPQWRARLNAGSPAAMAAQNPAAIARNHLADAALTAAEAGDLGPFERLLAQVQSPYDAANTTPPPPKNARPVTTYCGT